MNTTISEFNTDGYITAAHSSETCLSRKVTEYKWPYCK